MGLLSNIVGSFNPRGSSAPPPPPVTPPVVTTPPVASAGSGGGAPLSGQEQSGAGAGLARDVAFEPQPQPAAETPPLYSVAPVTPASPAQAGASVGAVREIGLPRFDAVRLQPAFATAAKAISVPADPAPVQAQAEQAELAPVMQAASIYTRAAYLLLAENGPSTQQRILQSL